MSLIKVKQFRSRAEQVCLQPVLEHRQRRGRCNIAWQAIPHLCSSNRKGTTSNSWLTTGWNVKLFSGGGPEPASVWHVGDICEWWCQVRWCGAMQCMICQRHHLECNVLRHAEPIKTDERVSDVSQRLRLKMSLAVAFWTDWRRCMWVRGKSIRRLLQQSNLLRTSAETRNWRIILVSTLMQFQCFIQHLNMHVTYWTVAYQPWSHLEDETLKISY